MKPNLTWSIYRVEANKINLYLQKDIPGALARLMPPQAPSSLRNPKLHEAETRRTPHEGSEISQSNVAEGINSSPKPPVNAFSINDKGKAVVGKVETQHSTSKDPPLVDLCKTPQASDPCEDFGNFLDLGDLKFGFPDFGVESSQNATNHFDIAEFANALEKEDDLDPRPQVHSGSKDDDLQGSTILPKFENEVDPQSQSYQVHGSTRKPHQSTCKDGWIENNSRGQKRRFSPSDTDSPSAMILERPIRKHQKRSEKITSQDILLGMPSQKYSEDVTDPLWPNTLEKALERWTNLKQNEINTDVIG
jgi:hypothetical protein